MISIVKVHVSARVATDLARYLDEYQAGHGLKTRSEVLELAIRVLRDKELEGEYAVAMDEWKRHDAAASWDRTAGDGLELDAAW